MVLETLLSQDVIKENIAKEAGNALRELNAQIVNEQRISVKTNVDETTYDATADFQKFAEKTEKLPPLDIEKVKEIIKTIDSLQVREEKINYIKNNESKIKDFIKQLKAEIAIENKKDMACQSKASKRKGTETDAAARELKSMDLSAARGHAERARKLGKMLFKLRSYLNQLELAELDKNFAENGVTVEQIKPGSQLDKDLKALGMKVFKEKDDWGYVNVYVEIDGKKVEVATEEFDKEYFIISRKNGEEIIVSFKKIKKEAGKIYYTEFRENSAKNLVEEWDKYRTSNKFRKTREHNLKPINNQDTNNSIGYNR